MFTKTLKQQVSRGFVLKALVDQWMKQTGKNPYFTDRFVVCFLPLTCICFFLMSVGALFGPTGIGFLSNQHANYLVFFGGVLIIPWFILLLIIGFSNSAYYEFTSDYWKLLRMLNAEKKLVAQFKLIQVQDLAHHRLGELGREIKSAEVYHGNNSPQALRAKNKFEEHYTFFVKGPFALLEDDGWGKYIPN